MTQVGGGPARRGNRKGLARGQDVTPAQECGGAAVARRRPGDRLTRAGGTAATLTGWHDAFLAAGEAALMTRAAMGEELESERLTAKLGAAPIEHDLLNEKIALLEAGRPFARRRRKP
jgi:transposase